MIVQSIDYSFWINPVIVLNPKATLCFKDNVPQVWVQSRTEKNGRRFIRATDLIKILGVLDHVSTIVDGNIKSAISYHVKLKKPIPLPKQHEGQVDLLAPQHFDYSLLWSYEFETGLLAAFADKLLPGKAIVTTLTGVRGWDQTSEITDMCRRKVRYALNRNKDNAPTIRLFRIKGF